MRVTTILSIQSSVAYGHVGNSAATFPLMRLGVEVWPVLTVHFSNNTSYPGKKGPLLRRVVPAALLAMVNPLAGLLPLLDTGDDDGRSALQACQRVLQQHAGGR